MKLPFRKITEDNIDFSDWNFPKLDEVREGILEAFEEVILAACEEGATARLPFIYSISSVDDDPAEDGEGGPAVLDPLLVRIGIPLGGNADNMPSWDLDLGLLIEEEVALMDGSWTGDGDVVLLTRMRDRLAGLVKLVDKQIVAQKKQ
jgi:hypothetical protein